MQTTINPITRQDYPDPDVIRVKDTYYMVSTTMHFMPGCVILRSYDLVHWEIASYVYDRLEETNEECLNEANAYGKGMWAASIRYHKDTFYVCFVANDTHKTYLFYSKSVEGPWKRQNIEGFYHDCSLLFDDNRVFIVYGNKEIKLTELNSKLTAPKIGGLNRTLVNDIGNNMLGYEGSHLYKIHGKYYLFLIHSLKTEWRRVEACFVSDSLVGEFIGGDVFNDDRGYCNQGVAQGGIVDTPDGKWYAILFQDSGAIGRMPILIPMHFEGDLPVIGINGKVPEMFEIKSTKPEYIYQPLQGSDDFNWKEKEDGTFEMPKFWQWNHNPDHRYWTMDSKKKAYVITTGKLCENVEQSVNTLTQRMYYPSCEGSVTVDGSQMKNGDYAGICAFQSCYGIIALTKQNENYYLVMIERNPENSGKELLNKGLQPEQEVARIKLDTSIVTLKIHAEFDQMKDTASFYFKENGVWKQFGKEHKLYFLLDHFTGCRFGLFCYATKEIGGSAAFMKFEYEY
ncbi:MAG: family 43 glycosylhydrolase [Clostridiales bacterium]|nr:family 43 glycosylhydrolase [Clostridiales bacterium]